ncbi:hypothetical protein [Paenibacillus sp. SI8]|uniref:XkdQ/YqbQ family protein n=1 Tax=unclassified Paenibacillus TaxID=185978 RepID=UPI0034660A82
MAVINVLYDGSVYIDSIVTSVQWSGDITFPARKLEVNVSNTIDSVKQALTLEVGKELRLFYDDTELFRGVIFRTQIDSAGKMTLLAYDENVYLDKNVDTKKFVNMTASAVIREICADFEIPTGTVADTDYVIPSLHLRNKKLYEMMLTALTVTRKQTGRRFFLYAKNGQLNLTERRDMVTTWVLENGTNITGANYMQSIEDLRNQVKVTGGDEEKAPLVAVVKNQALIDRFGLMQHVETADSDAKQSEIEQMARELLDQLGKISDEAGIEALGNVEVTTGGAVYVREAMTGIIGAYYVSTDTHTFEDGSHRMSVTLSATDDLPTMEYEESDAEKKAVKTPIDSADYAKFTQALAGIEGM